MIREIECASEIFDAPRSDLGFAWVLRPQQKNPFDEKKILRDDKRGSLTAGSLAGQGRGCFAGVILPPAPETTITTKRLRFRDSG
jgi:hypothetical protein